MKDVQIRCIADMKCTLGEGPVWDDRNQALYWVDILDNKIYRCDLSSGSVDWWATPEHVGFIVLKKEGELIAGLKSGLHHIALKDNHSVSASRIDRVDNNREQIRFNDGICDRQGRIWGCTMDMHQEAPLGIYYRYDHQLNRTSVDEGYVVANGPALSPDGNFLYTVETAGRPGLKKGIYVSAMHDTQSITEKELLVDWQKHSSVPDGVITDAGGNLWVGAFGGNILRCYSPEGQLKHEIVVPGWNVTKAAFAGDVLYVTTARYTVEESIIEKFPKTGGVFEIRGVGTTGQPAAYFPWYDRGTESEQDN